jgi:hypothetical protein
LSKEHAQWEIRPPSERVPSGGELLQAKRREREKSFKNDDTVKNKSRGLPMTNDTSMPHILHTMLFSDKEVRRKRTGGSPRRWRSCASCASRCCTCCCSCSFRFRTTAIRLKRISEREYLRASHTHTPTHTAFFFFFLQSQLLDSDAFL